uniref:Uncharacterized protein n=1 Tax=Avena sativa TaxID=4498 RepID=A0ACD5XBL9_AVESA
MCVTLQAQGKPDMVCPSLTIYLPHPILPTKHIRLAGYTCSSVHGPLKCGPAIFRAFPPNKHQQEASASSTVDQRLQLRGQAVSPRQRDLELALVPAVGSKHKMDAAGTSKRGRRPTKPQKLKFKPKVPSHKLKKSTAKKPQLEGTKPIDAELIKTLRTGRGDAKTLRAIKDEQSAQNSEPTVASAARVSLPPVQSGGQKRAQPKRTLQIPRALPVAVTPERFYGYEDDDDEDEDDNDVELQEPLPSSTECESSVNPAKELNLLDHDDKTRMFLFQLPKSLPLLRTSSTVVQRNGKAIVREVKEGYSLNDLPGGYMGKMLVYKSGKVKMKLGDALFDVSVCSSFVLLITCQDIHMYGAYCLGSSIAGEPRY